MGKKCKAIFLDKDGTLIEDVPYNVDPEKIKLNNGVGEALLRWKQDGFKLIVITNQAGVAHGYFKEEKLQIVEKTIRKKLEAFNVEIDGFYYCPHHISGRVPEYAIDCNCRKPKAGMIKRVAEELNIDLKQSWMVGDILHDIEAGNKAGCKTILINNGNETEWEMNEFRRPSFIVSEMMEAADKTGCNLAMMGG